MSEENVEVVRRMLAAFNRGDLDAVVATFDKECVLSEPPETPDRPTGGFCGHHGIRDWITNLREVAGVEFEPRGFTTSGDIIITELASRGQGRASGVPVEWTTFAVLWLRDGKITRVQGFLSQNEALEAAGLRE